MHQLAMTALVAQSPYLRRMRALAALLASTLQLAQERALYACRAMCRSRAQQPVQAAQVVDTRLQEMGLAVTAPQETIKRLQHPQAAQCARLA